MLIFSDEKKSTYLHRPPSEWLPTVHINFVLEKAYQILGVKDNENDILVTFSIYPRLQDVRLKSYLVRNKTK